MNRLDKIRYNCRQATFLIEKKQLSKLSFGEEIELRIHIGGCSVCKLYSRQSLMINNLVKQLFKAPAGNTARLDDTFKKGLQERIEHELNKD